MLRWTCSGSVLGLEAWWQVDDVGAALHVRVVLRFFQDLLQ